MKINKYVEELRAKSASELNEELVAAKKELFNLRFKNATNQLDNTSRIKAVSYTHLDVYKRQVLYCHNKSFPGEDVENEYIGYLYFTYHWCIPDRHAGGGIPFCQKE